MVAAKGLIGVKLPNLKDCMVFAKFIIIFSSVWQYGTTSIELNFILTSAGVVGCDDDSSDYVCCFVLVVCLHWCKKKKSHYNHQTDSSHRQKKDKPH